MRNYLINELVGRRVLSILIKSGLGGALVAFQMNEIQEYDREFDLAGKIVLGMMLFFFIYMVCSLFQLCLSITQNYIIGFITTIVVLVGGSYGLSKIEGSNASFFVFLGMILVFFVPVITDIWKLVTLIRMKE